MTHVPEHGAAEAEPTPEPTAPASRLDRGRRRRGLARISIQSKLLLMLVLCTMLAAAVVGAIAFWTGRNAMRETVFNQLTEVRQSQSRALENQISDLRNSLIVYTHGSVGVGALEAFSTGFDQLATAATTPAQEQTIADYYSNGFVKEVEQNSGTKLDAAALLPRSNAQRYLQANYTAHRPHTLDEGDAYAIALDDAHDGSAWSAANAHYQDFFRQIVTRYEFQDAMLLDARGNVVYTAYKDVDLGTNILDGPYSGSTLRGAYLKAMSSNALDYVGFTDFELYQPAEMQPTAWMVAPLRKDGKTEGVLALQFPITKINRLMTFDKQWAQTGQGKTGETILAGPDSLMRSDSRLFLENPQQYRQEVVAAGTPPDVADMAIRQGGTTLVQPLSAETVSRAHQGLTGTLVTTDYLGHETLQAYAPLSIKDSELHWSIVAKVDTAEAFARESTFTRTTVLASTGIILLVCLLAVYLAQVFVRPIKRLRAGAQQISAGDYHVDIPVETHDEIGDLTEAFNEMGRNLTVKEDQITQQRAENDQLLHSFMPATVATRFRKGEDLISIEREHVTVIFIDFLGLDRLQADLAADEYLALLDELVRQIGSASSDFGVEGVRTVRNGYLATCGLAVPRLDNLARTVDFAQQCEQIVEQFNAEFNTSLRLRAGIGIGRVSGGLAGRHSIVYDIWGPAVNLAYQVKNASQQPGIYVTSRVHDTLQDTASFTPGGTITVDGQDQPIWRLSKVP